MPYSSSAFRSTVARRVFLLFVLAALIPALLASGAAYYAVERQLTGKSLSDLRAESKDYGLEVLERLRFASELLRRTGASGGYDATSVNSGYFTRVETRLDGPFRRSAIEVPSAQSSARTVLRTTTGDGKASVWLTVVRAHSEAISAQVSPNFLWGSPDAFPEFVTFCVFDDTGAAIFCPSRPDEDIMRDLRESFSASPVGTAAWTADGERFLAGYFTVPLLADFTVSGWTIVAFEAERDALASMSAFRSFFPPVIGIAVLLALWIAYHHVRRRLEPLRALADATTEIAEGNFSNEIAVAGDDELQSLGQSLDRMRRQLGRQFHALRALSDLDRQLLSTKRMQTVVETSVRQMVEVFQCECAAVCFAERDSERIGGLVWCTGDGTIRSKRVQLPADGLLPGGTPARVPARDANAAYLEPLAESGAETYSVLPIVRKQRIRGVVVLGYGARGDSQSSASVTPEDFSDRLAVALQTIDRAEQLHRKAHYDSLTSLPNRQLFTDRLEQCIARTIEHGHLSALLFIDLDHFKTVNDSEGHVVGDSLLRLAAQRIRKCVNTGDTVARLGGDEFTVILAEVRSPHEAAQACERMIAALSEPFQIEAIEHFVGASVGITMIPTDGATAGDLLRNADTAMYMAKSTGRRRFVFFEERMNRDAEERVLLRRDLQHALGNDEFLLYYQPKVDLKTSKVIGAEALIRWRCPRRGLMLPAEFVGIAEETGLVVPIGEWVIERATRQLAEWQKHGILDSVSVNVSYGQLRDSDIVATLKRVLRDECVEPSAIEIEITETMMAEDKAAVMETLATLRKLGVRVSIDDFGTGYSSFSYLTELSFDTLKVDKAFLDAFPGSSAHVAVVAAIIRLGTMLGKTVIAEGVETEDQRRALVQHGCRFAQGYLFSKPLPAREFEDYVRSGMLRKLA